MVAKAVRVRVGAPWGLGGPLPLQGQEGGMEVCWALIGGVTAGRAAAAPGAEALIFCLGRSSPGLT